MNPPWLLILFYLTGLLSVSIERFLQRNYTNSQAVANQTGLRQNKFAVVGSVCKTSGHDATLQVEVILSLLCFMRHKFKPAEFFFVYCSMSSLPFPHHVPLSVPTFVILCKACFLMLYDVNMTTKSKTDIEYSRVSVGEIPYRIWRTIVVTHFNFLGVRFS